MGPGHVRGDLRGGQGQQGRHPGERVLLREQRHPRREEGVQDEGRRGGGVRVTAGRWTLVTRTGYGPVRQSW